MKGFSDKELLWQKIDKHLMGISTYSSLRNMNLAQSDISPKALHGPNCLTCGVYNASHAGCELLS